MCRACWRCSGSCPPATEFLHHYYTTWLASDPGRLGPRSASLGAANTSGQTKTGEADKLIASLIQQLILCSALSTATSD